MCDRCEAMDPEDPQVRVLGAEGGCGRAGCNHRSERHTARVGMCLEPGCNCEAFELSAEIKDRLTTEAAEELLLFEHPPRIPTPICEIIRAGVVAMEEGLHAEGWDNSEVPVLVAFTIGRMRPPPGISHHGAGLRIADMNVPRYLWEHAINDHGSILHAVTEMAEFVQHYPEVMEGDQRRSVSAVGVGLEWYRLGAQGAVEGEMRGVFAVDVDKRFYACVRDRKDDKPVTVLQRPGQYESVIGGRHLDVMQHAPVVLGDFVGRIIETAWGPRPTREHGHAPTGEDMARLRAAFTEGASGAPAGGDGTGGGSDAAPPSGRLKPGAPPAGTPPESGDPPPPPDGSRTES